MPNNSHYNQQLKPLAKNLRNNSTRTEIKLWCEVLSKGKTGYTFLGQRPISNYIADFMCKELKLIIEVYRKPAEVGHPPTPFKGGLFPNTLKMLDDKTKAR